MYLYFFYLNYFILGKNFDKTRGKFLVEIKREICRFNSLSLGSKHCHDAKS